MRGDFRKKLAHKHLWIPSAQQLAEGFGKEVESLPAFAQTVFGIFPLHELPDLATHRLQHLEKGLLGSARPLAEKFNGSERFGTKADRKRHGAANSFLQ